MKKHTYIIEQDNTRVYIKDEHGKAVWSQAGSGDVRIPEGIPARNWKPHTVTEGDLELAKRLRSYLGRLPITIPCPFCHKTKNKFKTEFDENGIYLCSACYECGGQFATPIVIALSQSPKHFCPDCDCDKFLLEFEREGDETFLAIHCDSCDYANKVGVKEKTKKMAE